MGDVSELLPLRSALGVRVLVREVLFRSLTLAVPMVSPWWSIRARVPPELPSTSSTSLTGTTHFRVNLGETHNLQHDRDYFYYTFYS